MFVSGAAARSLSRAGDLSSGGIFRGESTGKVWLYTDPLTGTYAARVAQLENTPFRVASTADIQPLMQVDLIKDPAVGETVRNCAVGGPVNAVDRKYSVFDDSDAGSIPEGWGLMGAQLSDSDLFFRVDTVSNEFTRDWGTWIIQRIPALKAGEPYSLDFDGDGFDENVVW